MEIDEGAKLARRVDNLRQISAEEETRLEQFRKGQIEAIHQEISSLIGDRDALKGEIADLQQQRAEAMIPLDSEWDKIHVREEEIVRIESIISEREKSLKEEEDKLAADKQKLVEERYKATLLHGEADGRLAYIATLEVETREKNLEATKKLEDAEIQYARFTNDLSIREAAVAERERVMQIKQDQLAEDRRKLVEREILINDKYDSFNRIKT